VLGDGDVAGKSAPNIDEAKHVPTTNKAATLECIISSADEQANSQGFGNAAVAASTAP
jgi:hypothetical protein